MFIIITIIGFIFVFHQNAAFSSKRAPGKIIGGGFAEEGEFPFMLALLSHNSQICGASAISEVWALTAAHCVFNFDELASPTSLSLRSGSVKHAAGGYIHDVTKLISHHKYDIMQYDEDIAVLKVNQPFSINKLIGYVLLPLQGEPVKVGTKTVVIGWGLTEEGSISDLLKETTVDVVDEEICEEFPQFRGIQYISKNMICAVTEGTDSAPGDSGGPLVVLKGKKALQVGVVSWGLGTGQANDPGIYTKLSQYRFWIYMKTGI